MHVNTQEYNTLDLVRTCSLTREFSSLGFHLAMRFISNCPLHLFGKLSPASSSLEYCPVPVGIKLQRRDVVARALKKTQPPSKNPKTKTMPHPPNKPTLCVAQINYELNLVFPRMRLIEQQSRQSSSILCQWCREVGRAVVSSIPHQTLDTHGIVSRE